MVKADVTASALCLSRNITNQIQLATMILAPFCLFISKKLFLSVLVFVVVFGEAARVSPLTSENSQTIVFHRFSTCTFQQNFITTTSITYLTDGKVAQ